MFLEIVPDVSWIFPGHVPDLPQDVAEVVLELSRKFAGIILNMSRTIIPRNSEGLLGIPRNS